MLSAVVVLFFANFLLIFAKAFQQNSVVYKKWKWIPAGCYIMAGMEIMIISTVAHNASNGIMAWIAMGTGAMLGCYLGMWLHPLITGKGWGNKKHASV